MPPPRGNSNTSESVRPPQKRGRSDYRRVMAEMREEVERRERCAQVLGSWELLAWFSEFYNESIPQTRFRFLRELCGIAEDPRDVEWKDEQPEESSKKKKGGNRAEGSGSRSGRSMLEDEGMWPRRVWGRERSGEVWEGDEPTF
ncbi:hypothetical protein MMC21_002680 [Puttea exsequens]|nr:hypothetical protein [Puttea exsequens]